jgi:hypothetical protein
MQRHAPMHAIPTPPPARPPTAAKQRYNVKRRVAKRAPLTEDQFDRIVEEEEEVSSISGSDTDDSSSEEGDDDDGDEAWGGRRGGGGGGGGEGGQVSRRRGRRQGDAGRAPQLVFLRPDGTPLAVWRCLLCPDHNAKTRPPDSALLPLLQSMRAAAAAPTWVVLLLRGGHFAGAVFKIKKGPPGKGQHAGDPFEVVAHKTLHRYVVR